MKLHTRLLLGYGYLVTLVLIGAAGAALGFFSLGTSIGTVLDENFESVAASMGMLEALERQDSAVLTALMKKQEARRDVRTSEGSFLEALDRARANVTEEQERPVLDSIAKTYEQYREARDRLLAADLERPLASYESDCFPHFESVKTGVRELLELNQQAMVRADREAQAAAARRAVGYAALTVLALLSMGWLSRGLQRHVISRLEELRSVAEAVGRGDLRRRAAEQQADELSSVARELNRLLDSHEELRGRLQARQARLRELLLGLLEAQPSPAAVVGLGGEIVASTIEESVTSAIEQAAEELRSRIPGDLASSGLVEHDVPCGGAPFRFRLLEAGGKRTVGWLVIPI